MANLKIDPSQFPLPDSDQSDHSDIDKDLEEWVTITPSTVTSTISTLPKHLTLQPKTAPGRFGPSQRSPAYESHHGGNEVTTQNNDHGHPTSPPNPTFSLTHRLQYHLPNLTAIYIVQASSLDQPNKTAHSPDHHVPFSSLQSPYFAPPVVFHTPFSGEHYLRVCADCAKPQMTIFCDGTWTSETAGICSMHAIVLEQPRHSTARPSDNRISDSGIHSRGNSSATTKKNDTTGKGVAGCCTAHGSDIDRLSHHFFKDKELYATLLEAVQPFQRQETERAGIKVFDMTVPSSSELYAHKTGCRCVVNAVS